MLVLLGTPSTADESTHVAGRGPLAGHDAERPQAAVSRQAWRAAAADVSSDRSRLPTEAETSTSTKTARPAREDTWSRLGCRRTWSIIQSDCMPASAQKQKSQMKPIGGEVDVLAGRAQAHTESLCGVRVLVGNASRGSEKKAHLPRGARVAAGYSTCADVLVCVHTHHRAPCLVFKSSRAGRTRRRPGKLNGLR